MKTETKHLYNVVQHLIIALGYQADNVANLINGNTIHHRKDEFYKLIQGLQQQANEIETDGLIPNN